MWRPVTSGMVDVIYIGYAAFAGAFDTKRATICRLQANFTFDKCEFTLIEHGAELTGMTNCVQGGKYGAGIYTTFLSFSGGTIVRTRPIWCISFLTVFRNQATVIEVQALFYSACSAPSTRSIPAAG